jgi:hypothetical protein
MFILDRPKTSGHMPPLPTYRTPHPRVCSVRAAYPTPPLLGPAAGQTPPSSIAPRVVPAPPSVLLFLSAPSPAPTPFPFSPCVDIGAAKSSATTLLKLGPKSLLPPSLSLHRAFGPLCHRKPPTSTPESANLPPPPPSPPPSPSTAVPGEPPSSSPCQVGSSSSARARTTALATSCCLSRCRLFSFPNSCKFQEICIHF